MKADFSAALAGAPRKAENKRKLKMTDGLFSGGLALAAISLAAAGQVSDPWTLVFEKVTIAGMFAFSLWWITQQLSKKLDHVAEVLEKLCEKIDEMNRRK